MVIHLLITLILERPLRLLTPPSLLNLIKLRTLSMIQQKPYSVNYREMRIKSSERWGRKIITKLSIFYKS